MNIAEAKAKLSELVARAEAGEAVVIARDGEPVIALTPLPKPGALRGWVVGAGGGELELQRRPG